MQILRLQRHLRVQKIIIRHSRAGGNPVNFIEGDKNYYVYILASNRNGTLYTGITNSLIRRVLEHKTKYFKGFTEKYGVDKLVYYEIYGSPVDAIHREKCVKRWNRDWKLKLIEKDNPDWKDLSVDLF